MTSVLTEIHQQNTHVKPKQRKAMLLLFPTPSFPANFTPSKPLCLPHRRLLLLRRKAADFDSFTERSGYLFDLTASEADSLTEYGVSKIAAVYRRKPLILFRRLYQIGTTFGKWFALRYLDRVYDRSDLMFQVFFFFFRSFRFNSLIFCFFSCLLDTVLDGSDAD